MMAAVLVAGVAQGRDIGRRREAGIALEDSFGRRCRRAMKCVRLRLPQKRTGWCVLRVIALRTRDAFVGPALTGQDFALLHDGQALGRRAVLAPAPGSLIAALASSSTAMTRRCVPSSSAPVSRLRKVLGVADTIKLVDALTKEE